MTKLSRRSALKGIVAGGLTAGITGSVGAFPVAEATTFALKGNVNHAVCRWCYSKLSVEELCVAAKKIGITGIDLVGPADWPTLKKHGLHSSMCNGAEIGLSDGFNTVANHGKLIENYTAMIPKVAAAGYTNLICFSGNRRGMDDETGLKNCVEGLKQLLPLAEKHQVVLVMELLNSKVNHKDYQADRTSFGAELARRLGSPNFKLLYDIYHMQIDEGDVIRTIKANHQYIAHYHTGGVPGRAEIDESQELYYPAIINAILATGFKGFVAQEFIPAKADVIASLANAIKICDV